MNRINQLFASKPSGILSIYYTAGYPNLHDTLPILQSLQASGVHMVEIGIPYSDPVADGPTIQNSSQAALNNGITVQILFTQLAGIRNSGITIPILLMGYLNPILQYGIEPFLIQCQSIGIDGLIIPDLPIQEYQSEYQHLFQQYGIHNTFLITPQTTATRVQHIDNLTQGFIYMVSSAGTTGAKAGISHTQEQYFQRINAMKLKNPTLIGFGISDYQTFQTANQFAQGAIIGSAFVNILSQSKNIQKGISQYISHLLNKKT
jgi:tryptophan synthase alpha chain